MKNKKLKLQLNKETIAKLNETEMENVNGGAVAFLSLSSCNITRRNCCGAEPNPEDRCDTMQCPRSNVVKCCGVISGVA